MNESNPAATQPRVPEGVSSDGGQWKVGHLEEPAPMKLYDRTTGTCFNPPMASTAERGLEFWEQVEIPDITIQRARLLYNAQQRFDFAAHIQGLIDAHMQQWRDANPQPRTDSRLTHWVQARAEEEQHFTGEVSEREHETYFSEENPEYMDAVEAQQIVRAWFARRNGPNSQRFPGEFEKTEAHEVELYAGTETIGTLNRRYQLNRFADQLETVPDPAADAIYNMQVVLGGILHRIENGTDRTANSVERQEL